MTELHDNSIKSMVDEIKVKDGIATLPDPDARIDGVKKSVLLKAAFK